MSWFLAEKRLQEEGQGPYNRTTGRVPDKSNNLVFFSFAMVPKYIYLENVWYKHLLNTVSLPLYLAAGSDRIITKQGNNLLGLSMNWYVMTQIVYVHHFDQWVSLF